MAGNRESIIATVTALAERLAAADGLEVVSVELVGGGRNRVLRIFIDRPPLDGQTVPLEGPSGATLEDCEKMSHQIGDLLDTADVIPGEGYKLEVSTPGIERKLLKIKDYERFAGHPAKVVLLEPADGQKLIEGTLKGVAEGLIQVELSAGKKVSFPIEQVSRATLKFHW